MAIQGEILLMRAGRLAKHPCIVQVQGTTQNAYGEQSESWSQYVVSHFSIRPLAGRELFDVDHKYAMATHEMRGRYRAGIRADMRILFPRTFSTIGSAITSTTGTTVIVSDGSAFPPVNFRARLGPSTGHELIEVTAKAGSNSTSWTVVRGVDGTTPATHSSGDDVFLLVEADVVVPMDVMENDREYRILVSVRD